LIKNRYDIFVQNTFIKLTSNQLKTAKWPFASLKKKKNKKQKKNTIKIVKKNRNAKEVADSSDCQKHPKCPIPETCGLGLKLLKR
jgi:hypothetical protein